MPANSSFHTFLKVIKALFLFLFTFIFIIFVLYYFQQSFLIKNIEIISKDKIKLLGTEEYINKNLLLVSNESIILTFKQKNPFIKNLEVQKKLPNSLVLIPDLYTSIADIIVSNGYFRISDDGRILLKLKNYEIMYNLIDWNFNFENIFS